ncbi:hypothetical protein M404DRAFT_28994 [Pisolithus tinctorius Marx 270]|uniref:Uncharacterized protein n=1 Tax=Pisolithus tinctorius Marx 270 TaxID=870435 RepID=A0A0C3NJ41_PISTI|nr:hypothetical protein M404DRAFT_28994 [Pisolithus tinctorius Marx 270]
MSKEDVVTLLAISTAITNPRKLSTACTALCRTLSATKSLGSAMSSLVDTLSPSHFLSPGSESAPKTSPHAMIKHVRVAPLFHVHHNIVTGKHLIHRIVRHLDYPAARRVAVGVVDRDFRLVGVPLKTNFHDDLIFTAIASNVFAALGATDGSLDGHWVI